MYNKNSCENIIIPLTIEDQLKRYLKCTEYNDRYDILWNAWKHNKRWLSRLLDLTIISFTTYSRHDFTHAESIIHNIERLLGDDRISCLSASDCFCILHVAYLHDIGMCITAEDRLNIFSSDNFVKFIDELELYGDSDFKKFVFDLKRVTYDNYEANNNTVNTKNMKKLYKEKLNVYYAVISLIAEYQRKIHSKESRRKLEEWIMKPEKFATGFSMSGIPLRIFLRIADCAELHNDNNFENILNLPYEDDGYVNDMIHPRFVAVLLQLGDCLDLDNDRFHPFLEEISGEIPYSSQIHFNKHHSIRQLHITPTEISIEANCATQDVLRLVKSECDTIISILQISNYKWSIIAPKELKGCFPTVKDIKLYLNGKSILDELVTTKFKISQSKAFEILEGFNFYDNNFVFLRELVQNAIDATKFQYFHDFLGKYNCDEENFEKIKGFTPENFLDYINPFDYAIKVVFSIKKAVESDKFEDITESDIVENKNINCGVLIEVIDSGIGISSDDIKNIADVGTSYERQKNDINSMPKWLSPTGKFGIGLQSLFLVCNRFNCESRVRNGENFKIEFASAASYRKGYINVIPLDNTSNSKFSFGTKFKVFVPNEKKLLHRNYLKSWSGTDLFENDYSAKRPIRHSAELLSQLAFYLDDIISDALFPIAISIESNIGYPKILKLEIQKLKEELKNNLKNTIFSNTSLSLNAEEYIKEKEEYKLKTSWLQKIKEINNLHIKRDDANLYFLDIENSCLYIWDANVYTCAKLSANKILNSKQEHNNFDNDEDSDLNYIKIYYKGISTTQYKFYEDAGLLEYLYIKGGINRKDLKINRDGFTETGSYYIKEKVYKSIIQTSKKAINLFKSIILEEIEKITDEYESEKEINKLEENLLFWGMLSYFKEANMDFIEYKKNEKISFNDDEKEILESILLLLKNNNILEKATRIQLTYKNSTCTNPISFLDLLDNNQCFIINSERNSEKGDWTDKILKFNKNYKEDLYKFLINNYNLYETTNTINSGDNTTNIQKTLNDLSNDLLNDNNFYEIKPSKTVKWLLRYMPTLAIFSGEQGNKRFNILSKYSTKEIFFNNDMKLLILYRMIEKFKEFNIARFSTSVWEGFSPLAIKNDKTSLLYISRGYLSKTSRPEMIFPITNNILKELIDFAKNCKKNINGLNDLFNKNHNFKIYAKNQGIDADSNIINIINCAKKYIEDEIIKNWENNNTASKENIINFVHKKNLSNDMNKENIEKFYEKFCIELKSIICSLIDEQ